MPNIDDVPNARMVVRATIANLRGEPSHASELVSQLVLGEEVDVLDRSGTWVRVAGVDGYAGWVNGAALAEPPPGAALAESRAGADGPAAQAAGVDAGAGSGDLVWTRRDGTAFQGPEAGSAPLRDLVLGARARTAGGAVSRAASSPSEAAAPPDLQGRRRVTLPGGEMAWADAGGWATRRELARRFPPAADAVVRTALSLAGVPYLWGGTSTKALDCSGMVQRVFRTHGLELPRDAGQQALAGETADPGPGGADLRTGDLVFFAEEGTAVTHVGMALGRTGRFVHASVLRGGVGVDALDPADELYDPLLASTLVACRRVLTAAGRRMAPAARLA